MSTIYSPHYQQKIEYCHIKSLSTPPFATRVLASPSSSHTSLTPEMIQQMVVSTLSALGISGNPPTACSSWLLDSSASNHMTRDP